MKESRKEKINWIVNETVKLYKEDYGTMNKCTNKAIQIWKDKEKLRYKIALQKVFQEVEK